MNSNLSPGKHTHSVYRKKSEPLLEIQTVNFTRFYSDKAGIQPVLMD